jgi:protein O-GlcNAc transferase
VDIGLMVDRHSRQSGKIAAEIAENFRRAMTAHQSGQLADAERFYRRVLARDGRHLPSLQMLGLLCAQAGNFPAAERLFADALRIDPNDARCRFNRGNALALLNRLDEALDEFGKAVTLEPKFAEAQLNRGSILLKQKRLDEALACFNAVIAANPNYADAHCNRAAALEQLRQYDAALASYDKALAIGPNKAQYHASRANVLHAMKRYDGALAGLSQALALSPNDPEFHFNRGNVFFELKRYDEALADYDKAFHVKPDLEYLEGARLLAKMLICDWTDLAAETSHLVAGVMAGSPVCRPFVFVAVPSSPSQQAECARLFADREHPPRQPLAGAPRQRHDKIRIAYLSADFRDHAVAYLIAGMLEHHDRGRFATTAIAWGPDDNSEMRARIKQSSEFIDVTGESDAGIADLMRGKEIDIAVDLMGFTQHSRTAILAMRPAPIQVSHLGYVGTMGTKYIDYLIADRIIVPDDKREFYSEKIVYMPNSFQPNDRQRRIGTNAVTRAEAGLPQDGFVFCCFNNCYKITPAVFDSWMRILRQVNGSVLWLVGEGAMSESNLRREAAARGVGAERLVFAPRVPPPEYLARLRLADLFLDTLPYNAGTTASDALWVGLPVLTRIGETYAARMAASLLNAVDLPELVTATPQDYETLAVMLATQAGKLAAIKQKLADNRLTTSLFDTALFTRHIEAAYAAMVERHHAGLAPDHIVVPN